MPITPEEAERALSTGQDILVDGEGDERTALGLVLMDDYGRVIGRVTAATTTQAGIARWGTGLLIADVNTGVILGPLPGQGGDFLTQGGKIVSIGANGVILGTSSLTQNETRALQMGLPYYAGSGGSPTAAGGGGYAGRTIAEEIQLMEEQARIAREEGDWARARDYENQVDFLKMQQAFTTQEREKQEEFTMRLQLFEAAQDLARAQVEARQEAIREMGRDPWTGAILAQGGVPVGQSPHRRLREELFGFAEAELPTVGPEATRPELEAAMVETARLGTEIPRRPIGLAQGGVIEMEPGEDGYKMRNLATGQRGDAILVGESGTPEVVEMLSSGRLRVIPLAGRAQEGGEYELTPEERGAEARTRAQALLPLWQHLGLEQVPIGSRLPAAYGGMLQAPLYGTGGTGLPTRAPTQAAETFTALGVRPRVFWEPEKGVFLLGRPTGELQVLGPPEQARQYGELIAQAVVMPTREILELGYSPSGEVIPEGAAFMERTGRWGPRAPIYSPLEEQENVGLFLPDPRLLASVWNQLGPDTQRVAISAYQGAGISEDELMERMGFFTPRGLATTAGTARLA